MTDDKTKKVRLTKTAVEAIKPPATGEVRLWDKEVAGFCVRVYPSTDRGDGPRPRRVYALKYRVKGRQRWLTIGEHGGDGGKLTAERARQEAIAAKVDARRGTDPAAARRADDRMTVAQLIDRYLTEAPRQTDKREATWVQDRSNLERHTRPVIGKLAAAAVGPDDIAGMVADITAGKTSADVKTRKRGRALVKGGGGAAARVFSTTRAMFSWAIDQKILTGPNPCVVKKTSLAARPAVEKFLTEEQAVRLLETLAALVAEGAITNQQASIFQLLLFTGARRNEIAGLRWAEVDFDRQWLNLPPARTKAGGKNGNRHIILNSAAVAVLKDLEATRRKGERYVFPATKGKSGHTTSAPKVWREKVTPRAGLVGFRIHDLRHSFASFALADGASLPIIGKALGHASARTTERYAHLRDDPLRGVAEGIGRRFSEAGQ